MSPFRSTENITFRFSKNVGCIGEQQMKSICDQPRPQWTAFLETYTESYIFTSA